jgi:hypothetical protein
LEYTGDLFARAEVLHNLAIVEVASGDLDAAWHALDEAAAIADETSDTWTAALVRYTRALIHVLRGEPHLARPLFTDSLTAAYEQPIPWLACYCLLGLALVATLEHDSERAACLHGSCDAATARLGLTLEALEATLKEADVERLETVLGRDEFRRLHDVGAATDPQSMLAAPFHDRPSGSS